MKTYDEFIKSVQTEILMPIITLLAIIAFAVFVWGVVQMIAAAGDEEKRTTGQRHIVWGIVGLFILFGASSIVALLSSTISSALPN
ncbi:MAG: hypothetical protein AAB892_01645 [Patescibacteria group bacterium]